MVINLIPVLNEQPKWESRLGALCSLRSFTPTCSVSLTNVFMQLCRLSGRCSCPSLLTAVHLLRGVHCSFPRERARLPSASALLKLQFRCQSPSVLAWAQAALLNPPLLPQQRFCPLPHPHHCSGISLLRPPRHFPSEPSSLGTIARFP